MGNNYVTLSAFIDTALPILLSRLGVDSAVASGPFITTVNDITSVIIYYALSFAAFSAVL